MICSLCRPSDSQIIDGWLYISKCKKIWNGILFYGDLLKQIGVAWSPCLKPCTRRGATAHYDFLLTTVKWTLSVIEGLWLKVLGFEVEIWFIKNLFFKAPNPLHLLCMTLWITTGCTCWNIQIIMLKSSTLYGSLILKILIRPVQSIGLLFLFELLCFFQYPNCHIMINPVLLPCNISKFALKYFISVVYLGASQLSLWSLF